ncbi:hypothetical protein ASPZODRAFT_60073 [Penicilliopsis zonata CBS 506.65]|uniref:MaoC-like domain-containing protein n=1 Tax=Penicilliopsis zonata CBS 506.65 TaxID=1073090 RepID=A0A1L9SNV5_9EURO|nr:hypothetical protein ASPZODRAFT_60073 [Penicilliopsis zonata CBS 506.65]OJJ48783.1 hypothetical protein ASPZODRAFT_60073 [Penicilliopsis zonata CBS 506.65]
MFSAKCGLLVLSRASSSLSKQLHHELTSRTIPLSYDYLYPQQSHLLDLTLLESLENLVDCSNESKLSTTLPSIKNPPRMQVGHHLVYFPPQVALSQLLPDGTDTLHFPGSPFNSRLWAGGRVKFPFPTGILLDGRRAACLETIQDVIVRGRTGEEKVIVKIERRMGTVEEGEEEIDIRQRLLRDDEEQTGNALIVENRDLVFLRNKTEDLVNHENDRLDRTTRILKPPSNAEFRHKIKASKAMLFRFSALTFNAHSIHLDRAYTQGVEGHRDLLVHGPLTLVLLLSTLRRYLAGLEIAIQGIEYRNLTPLFVDENFAVCGKPKSGALAGTWDVWIENMSGGLAVRATVHTALVEPDKTVNTIP